MTTKPFSCNSFWECASSVFNQPAQTLKIIIYRLAWFIYLLPLSTIHLFAFLVLLLLLLLLLLPYCIHLQLGSVCSADWNISTVAKQKKGKKQKQIQSNHHWQWSGGQEKEEEAEHKPPTNQVRKIKFKIQKSFALCCILTRNVCVC